MNDIRTWSIEDIRSFHKTYYQPQNAILLITGDIEPEEAFAKAEKEFGSIKNCTDIPAVKFVEPEQDGPKRVMIQKESEVEMVAITFRIPNFQDPDQPKLSAISEMLSAGKSSRLYEELVDKKQLVNQIYAYNMENTDPGLFIFLASCNPGVTAESVEKELIAQIERIKAEKVSKEELEKVKISTKADFVFSLDSSSEVANLFGGYLARGDLKPLLEYEDAINALDAEGIQEAAKKYFDFSQSTTVILRKGE
jgi:predicted Zn-dependent peptidase